MCKTFPATLFPDMGDTEKLCSEVSAFPGDVLFRAAQVVEALVSGGTLVLAWIVVGQQRCRELPIHLNLKVSCFVTSQADLDITDHFRERSCSLLHPPCVCRAGQRGHAGSGTSHLWTFV